MMSTTTTNGMDNNRLRMSVSELRTPTTPISPSCSQFGRVARFDMDRLRFLTASLKLVAFVEAPDVAVGAGAEFLDIVNKTFYTNSA